MRRRRAVLPHRRRRRGPSMRTARPLTTRPALCRRSLRPHPGPQSPPHTLQSPPRSTWLCVCVGEGGGSDAGRCKITGRGRGRGRGVMLVRVNYPQIRSMVTLHSRSVEMQALRLRTEGQAAAVTRSLHVPGAPANVLVSSRGWVCCGGGDLRRLFSLLQHLQHTLQPSSTGGERPR